MVLFNNIVSSLVKDIITPLIGILLGKIDIKDRCGNCFSENYIWCILAKHSRLCNYSFLCIYDSKTINRLSNLRKVEEEKLRKRKDFKGRGTSIRD